jgi:predicted phosphodiesterase
VRFLFKTEVPPHPLDVVLGRPSARSITASILAFENREGFLEYGTQPGKWSAKTPPFALSSGEPAEILLEGLQPDTSYVYRLQTRPRSGGAWSAEPERHFHTQRSPGHPFTFTLQADSHLDYNTDPPLYLRCLQNMQADRPDFLIDLGDTFMNDKHRTREAISAHYLAQRFYLGQITHSVPLFLVLGNHDGEAGRWLDGTRENLAVWSNLQRKRFYPNPIPGGIYTGNTTPDPQAGLLQNYYAWEWGDALFIALDPFWFTARQRGGEDNWSRTLGREQYLWLQKTLEQSRAPFRFVFLHHLVGGIGKDARGGLEAAGLYEWGGHEPDGASLFSQKRPGWPMPIHQLLLKHRVNAVFHGHDHLYVHQELDGIVYQEVPQPGHARYDNTRSAAEYGYRSGTIQGSSGHLRVQVAPQKTVVEYVRSYLPADERAERRNGAVTHRYELLPRPASP